MLIAGVDSGSAEVGVDEVKYASKEWWRLDNMMNEMDEEEKGDLIV